MLFFGTKKKTDIESAPQYDLLNQDDIHIIF